MAKFYSPTPDEVAVLTILLVQRYAKDRKREVNRFRLSKDSLRLLGIRTRLRDAFIEAWTDVLHDQFDWLVFCSESEFCLVKKDVAATWTRIGSKRLKDIINKLRHGDPSGITDAENEIEWPENEEDEEHEED